jgi:hypothetical protein
MKMKFIKIIIGLLVISISAIYIILFTPINKKIFIPIIEKNIKKSLKIDSVKISTFELTMDKLKLSLLLKKEKIRFNATFNIFDKTLVATYNVKINDLSLFNQISNQKLKGSFFTQGKINGKFCNIILKGQAQVAKGIVDYRLNVIDKNIKNIILNIKGLQLSAILDMITQPPYAEGTLNINAKIKSLHNMEGLINTSIDDGLLNTKVIKNDFNISLPIYPTYTLNAITILNKNLVSTKSILNTLIAKIETKHTVFNIKTAILKTDYILSIPKLSDLFFITQKKMKGSIKINGDVTYNKSLIATFNSNKFDGNISGLLNDNQLDVNIKNINSLQLLDMMYYPKIFKSKLNIQLDYDLIKKVGHSHILMNEGQFLVTKFGRTLKKLTKKDLTAEIYKITEIKTKINNQKLNNTLFMKSNNSTITSKKIDIDLKNSIIDSSFDIQFYKIDFALNVKGDLISPKVKLDTSELLKEQVKQKIKAKMKKAIEKQLGDKVKNNLGRLLKNLF